MTGNLTSVQARTMLRLASGMDGRMSEEILFYHNRLHNKSRINWTGFKPVAVWCTVCV